MNEAYLKLLKSEYMSKDHLPQAGLACLPVQEEGPGLDWPISLLRTGLSSCSGRGSRTGLVFLPAPEQGPRLDWPVSLLRKRVLPLGQDWPPCPRRGTWTLQEPILCCLSQPFRAYINKKSEKSEKEKNPSLAEDNLILVFFQDIKNIKHQWANTSTYPIKKSF